MRLADQEEKIHEQTMEKEEQATNPFALLWMDEEEELEDEEMEHESDGEKMTLEGGQEETMEEEKGSKEVAFEEEEFQAIKEVEKGDDF